MSNLPTTSVDSREPESRAVMSAGQMPKVARVPRARHRFLLPLIAAALLGTTVLPSMSRAQGDTSSTSTPTPPKKASTAKKPEPKKADAKKPDSKKADARKSDPKKIAAKPAAKPASAKPAPAAQALAVPAAAASAPAFAAPSFGGAAPADLQRAISLVEQGNSADALSLADSMRDPGAQALVRWLALRVTARDVGYDRAVAILQAHPTLPTPVVLRRRLEYLLYAENKDPQTILAFFAEQSPLSGEGKIALARALFAAGDQKAGAAWLRDAWHEDALSSDTESTVMVEFGGLLTRADHKYRADKMIYGEDADRGLRAAQRAGDDVTALARARIALFAKNGDPAKLLAAVPGSLRSDPAYLYALAKLQRRNGDYAAAARTLASGPKDPVALVDPDEWWVERRLTARGLLDSGDARAAYKVVRESAVPENEHKRADQQFTAGWIALRFLNDPKTALQHFSKVAEKQVHPATISRGYYWQGRAWEALGSTSNARQQYEQASHYSTAYYGQLAAARLSTPTVKVHAAPAANAAQRAAFARDEGVMIYKLLQKLDKSSLQLALAYDLAERLPDAAQLGMLAEVARADGDARTMTTIGKIALSRGFLLEAEAYPTIGIPSYRPIAPDVDRALVFAIARQESMFNPAARSSAGATGLMQVMPATGRSIANRAGVAFNPAQLGNPTVNVQFGAAELRSLLDNYHNNYILTFAGYNAGRGNVSKWIAAYGDPRDPAVDPIDWVERIPFSETRNYVQRVMENAQIYKARFGSRTTLQIEADLRGSRL
ncbi:lytic transglycosylase domain-containing protein [Ancylobacter amanitiformis]|uniref:Soluble lytic murein transglycosylase n=1 Tax=Ancylobacter amanitiformis TaxID=217069 RepID=A0ABU0LPZ0_9HYPH|nr:lytic transglycosylase domain-containing protein [Ancylobacter amanitiformis]MDQ0510759.1 soluble lytic murein transglycosylase [Ancylobacter amanitiformis]